MSRHRNYRNYQYEDDMSDDVYGHSVEDHDICVSPTTAEQFMFRRSNSREPNLSSYMTDKFDSVEEEEEESEEEPLASSLDYKRPKLDPESEAKLLSCLDQMQSILGDTCHEPTAVEAILRHNFDLERAVDQVLGGDAYQDQVALPGPRKPKDSLCTSKQFLVKNKSTKACSGKTSLQKGRVLKESARRSDQIVRSENALLPNTQGEAEMSSSSPQAPVELWREKSTVSPSTDLGSLKSVTTKQSSSSHQLLSQPLSSLSPSSAPLPRDPKTSSLSSLATSQGSPLGSLASVPQGTLADSGGLSFSGPLGALPSLSSLAHSQETPNSPLQPQSLSALARPGGLSLGSLSGAFPSFPSQTQAQESSRSLLSAGPLSALSSPGGPSLNRPLGAFPSLSSLAHSGELSHSPRSAAPANPLVHSGILQTEDQSEVGTSKLLLSAPLSSLVHANMQDLPNTLPSFHSLSRTQHEEKAELISSEKNTTSLQRSPFSAATSLRGTSEDSQLCTPGAVSLSDLAKLQSTCTSTAPVSTFESLAKKPATSASESQLLGSLPLGVVSLSELSQHHVNPAPGLPLSSLARPASESSRPGAHSMLGSVSLSELARPGSHSVPLKQQVPLGHIASVPDTISSSALASSGHALASAGFPSGLQVRFPPPGLLGSQAQTVLAKDLQGLSLSDLGTCHTSNTRGLLPQAPTHLVDSSRSDDQKSSQNLSHELTSTSCDSKPSVPAVSVMKRRVNSAKPPKSLESSLANAPSMFALTLCSRAPGCAAQNFRAEKAGHHRPTSPVCVFDLSIKPFDFSTPSPDDVVLAKQRKAFSKNKK